MVGASTRYIGNEVIQVPTGANPRLTTSRDRWREKAGVERIWFAWAIVGLSVVDGLPNECSDDIGRGQVVLPRSNSLRALVLMFVTFLTAFAYIAWQILE